MALGKGSFHPISPARFRRQPLWGSPWTPRSIQIPARGDSVSKRVERQAHSAPGHVGLKDCPSAHPWLSGSIKLLPTGFLFPANQIPSPEGFVELLFLADEALHVSARLAVKSLATTPHCSTQMAHGFSVRTEASGR